MDGRQGQRDAAWAERPRGRWLRRVAFSGGALSLLIHVFVLAIAALIPVRFAALSGDRDAEGQTELAVMTEAELADLAARSIDDGSPDLPEFESLVEVETPARDPSPEVRPLGDQPLDVELSVGGGDIGTIGEAGNLGAGGITATFFGLEAQGTRFAYIVDVSSSMRNENRWARTEAELLRSISAIPENGRFLVAFYSDATRPLFDEWRWLDGTDRSKRAASSAIRQIEPAGGTQPQPAFDAVFGMSVRPEAIYFMTDGRIPSNVPQVVARLNGRDQIPVHCVFFSPANESAAATTEWRALLLRISRESGGRFVTVVPGS